MTQLIREAESSRSPRQALIEQVASYFVPIALSVAFIVWFIKSQSEAPGAREDAVLHALTRAVRRSERPASSWRRAENRSLEQSVCLESDQPAGRGVRRPAGWHAGKESGP